MPVTVEELNKSLTFPLSGVFEKHGITPDYLAKKLKRELNAKVTKFFQKDGKVIEERVCIDHATRQKARMDAHRLRGDYPAEKQELTIPGGVRVTFDSISPEEREALLKVSAVLERIETDRHHAGEIPEAPAGQEAQTKAKGKHGKKGTADTDGNDGPAASFR
jgi:hypothetical protein